MAFSDEDYLNYILSNPDLRENAEAEGLTQAEMVEMGEWHWTTYGENENRQNTPAAVTNDEGYTEALTSDHYQGRDVYDVLQASVRAGGYDPSLMWKSREDIDSAWNQLMFNAQNWNLNPDNPYRSGILAVSYTHLTLPTIYSV